MPPISARAQLCSAIVTDQLAPGQWCNLLVPARYDDIDADLLSKAEEAIYTLNADQVRHMLPFVLDALERKRTELFAVMYIGSFLGHIVPAEFWTRNMGTSPKYRQEYRQNWVAPMLASMNQFEHRWAYDWIDEILKADDADVMPRFQEDLTMVARIFGMALNIAENEVPFFDPH